MRNTALRRVHAARPGSTQGVITTMLKSFRFVLALLCVGLVCGTGPSARAADSVLPYGANLFRVISPKARKTARWLPATAWCCASGAAA